MARCEVHTEFFDDSCPACRQEYLEMKVVPAATGHGGSTTAAAVADQGEKGKGGKYKELSEERAKKLYEELMLQYLKTGSGELEASQKAKAILRKQCNMRGISHWPWLD